MVFLEQPVASSSLLIVLELLQCEALHCTMYIAPEYHLLYTELDWVKYTLQYTTAEYR